MFFLKKITLLVCLSMSTALSGVEIAITLDDHPMPQGTLFSLNERVERYCQAFEKNGCKGAFFCIGSYCEKQEDFFFLTQLNESGHFLANHSFNHRHLSPMDLSEFQNEVEKTDVWLSSYSQFRKWFRFPFLDYGRYIEKGGSEEKYRAAVALLKKLGYSEGFITINTFDWYIESRLQKALQEKKEVDYQKLKEAYLFLLNAWCSDYIAYYEALFGNDVTHVLLLHANDLNALFLDDLLKMIHNKGWFLVSPEKAFNNSLWEERVAKEPQILSYKPDSLPHSSNCKSIDDVLERYHVFIN